MKIIKKLAVISTLILIVAVISGCFMYRNARDMPIKWPDQQGGDIVTVISSEFIIPVDPMSDREGIYHSGWAYRRDNIWNTGSVITIYGVKDIDLQNLSLIHI